MSHNTRVLTVRLPADMVDDIETALASGEYGIKSKSQLVRLALSAALGDTPQRAYVRELGFLVAQLRKELLATVASNLDAVLRQAAEEGEAEAAAAAAEESPTRKLRRLPKKRRPR